MGEVIQIAEASMTPTEIDRAMGELIGKMLDGTATDSDHQQYDELLSLRARSLTRLPRVRSRRSYGFSGSGDGLSRAVG